MNLDLDGNLDRRSREHNHERNSCYCLRRRESSRYEFIRE
jgi:hypothetical protein